MQKHNFVYFMHLFLFAINLIDFSLLAFEFSLGMGHEYPYSQFTCTLYQSVVKGNPIIQASAIVVLIFYTAKTYLTPQNLLPPQQTSELICSRNEQNNVMHYQEEVIIKIVYLHYSYTFCSTVLMSGGILFLPRTRSFSKIRFFPLAKI